MLLLNVNQVGIDKYKVIFSHKKGVNEISQFVRFVLFFLCSTVISVFNRFFKFHEKFPRKQAALKLY